LSYDDSSSTVKNSGNTLWIQASKESIANALSTVVKGFEWAKFSLHLTPDALGFQIFDLMNSEGIESNFLTDAQNPRMEQYVSLLLRSTGI
jgi:hypothetical protein